ncbi:MAG: DUF2061 domain-containing protein [Thalassobaculum sp.]|uniref:DUF2061 domain-containing protein n=1 Tax=Thalassobaculum sp. TaxID=2022740 RepID=UPI0032EF9437
MTGPDDRTRTSAGQTAAVQGAAASPRASRGAMSRRHSLAKTVSWRVTATIDTFIISFFVTGSFAWASSIASLEVLTKMGLYYLHERAWARVDWG